MNDVSEKSVQEKYFNQYRSMIEGAAWRASRIFKMDVEDLRAQCYLIFCEAINTYNPTKASFSTYLCNRLRTVNDSCVCLQRRQTDAFYDNTNFKIDFKGYGSGGGRVWKRHYTYEKIISRQISSFDDVTDYRQENFVEAIERLESKSELSKDAQDILSFILGREWEDVESKVKRVPRYSAVSAIYKKRNWQPSRTKKAWSEIKTWWVSSAVYMEA